MKLSCYKVTFDGGFTTVHGVQVKIRACLGFYGSLPEAADAAASFFNSAAAIESHEVLIEELS